MDLVSSLIDLYEHVELDEKEINILKNLKFYRVVTLLDMGLFHIKEIALYLRLADRLETADEKI